MKNKPLNSKLILSLIIFLLITSIAIILILLYLNTGSENNMNENFVTPEEGEDVVEYYGTSSRGGIDIESYFDINTCMKKYLNAINMKSSEYGSYDEENNYTLTVEESEIKQKIYNILSQKYINENNINTENVFDYVEVLNEATVYVPLEASLINSGTLKSFLIHGLIEKTEDYSLVDEIFAIVNININEGCFSIEPIYGEYASIDEIKIEQFEDTIITTEDNPFKMTNIKAEDFPKEYITLFKRLSLGHPEKMYNLLDKQYREARFGNVEGFKQYVEENKIRIKGIRLEKYQSVNEEDYSQYICVDQNENYYIFNEKAVLDYTVILDTYTIDLPEFLEKYEVAKNSEKVLYNIQKIFDAINAKDYAYVYNKLDNTFKQNNFKTLEDFEDYIEDIFYTKNTLSYSNYSLNGDVHMYDITVTNMKKEDAPSITKTFVMQLKQGTDFVMSFEV